MDSYIKISIRLKEEAQSAILIALLSDCGFDGFEEKPHFLDAFIKKENYPEQEVESIIDSNSVDYTKIVIEPENWNMEWEKNFDPVSVEDFCAIRASFHAPIKNKKHEIIITPKMSFGTGHHATTWLMIKAMSQLDLKGKKLLDFGTGTGVLAILAEKCGAEPILAIDNDSWSVQNAAENIENNYCSKISLEESDSIGHTGKFDVVLANINKRVILQNFAYFQQHLSVEGVLIVSGFLESDLQQIENECILNHFSIDCLMERESWGCLVLKHPKDHL